MYHRALFRNPPARYAPATEEEREEGRQMLAGPFATDGEIRIPSYVYYYGATQEAAAQWKKRGFLWNPARHEWFRSVSPEQSSTVLAEVRQRYFEIFKFLSSRVEPDDAVRTGEQNEHR